MAKFPEPPDPAALASVKPALRVLPEGTELWRIYFRGPPHPTTWRDFRAYGPVASARFDHHLLPARVQARQILYAADAIVTSIAEAFQKTRVVDRTDREPWLVGFRLARPVTVLDLTTTWPTKAGASMNLSSGARPRARRWSQTIYAAYSNVEGLYYPSSMHANKPAVALYERSRAAVRGRPTFNRPLVDPALLTSLRVAARRLGYRLA